MIVPAGGRESAGREPSHVVIVGAGLAGSLLACYLSRRGMRVTLYERRPDPRAVGTERGRSINLALSARGLDALARVGLEDQVMATALPMRGRQVHDERGETVYTSYSADGERAINSISRSALNDTLLLAALESPLVSVVFDHRLLRMDPGTGSLEFETPAGAELVDADVVVGADGAFSAVRARIQNSPGVNYEQEYLDCQYKELSIPSRDGEFALNPEALHVWPRGRSMMIALPNPDRSFTCTLFWPRTGPDSFEEVGSGADAVAYFRRRYPDAVALMPDLGADFDANPIGSLVTVRCSSWVVEGRVVLVGDAAHAIVPFFGQGANAAFEDVVELDRCLTEHGDDWGAALPDYQRRRLVNANAIADMALANFVEMSDKSGSRVFRLTKEIQHGLERLLPDHYVSRYELVSFSTIPYAEVVNRTTVPSQVRSVVRGFGHLALCNARAVLARKDRESP
jgi:kynurenine 3-monooxygenase